LTVDGSHLLVGGFAALSLAVAAFLIHRMRIAGLPRAPVVYAVWVGLTGALAAGGVLAVFEGIPRPVPVFVAGIALTLAICLGRSGARLLDTSPLWLLIGFQAFRIPVELLIHLAGTEGVAPMLMTWSGRNFDIITGLAAVPLGLLAARDRLPRIGQWRFALGGLGLLINVVGHAVLAMPSPIRVFETVPPNTWIASWPYIWLPTVLVTAALGGHVLLIRRLVQRD